MVNVSHLFGKTFYSQIKHIRRVCIVSLVFLIIMTGIILFMTFYMSPRGYSLSTPLFSNEYVQTPMHIIMIWCVLMIVILFPAFFAEKKERIGEQQKKDNRFRDDDEGVKISTNKLKQAIFPLDENNKRKTQWIKITNWSPDDSDIPDPGSKRRGRITQDFKIAPFFEHVAENEFGY